MFMFQLYHKTFAQAVGNTTSMATLTPPHDMLMQPAIVSTQHSTSSITLSPKTTVVTKASVLPSIGVETGLRLAIPVLPVVSAPQTTQTINLAGHCVGLPHTSQRPRSPQFPTASLSHAALLSTHASITSHARPIPPVQISHSMLVPAVCDSTVSTVMHKPILNPADPFFSPTPVAPILVNKPPKSVSMPTNLILVAPDQCRIQFDSSVVYL